MAAYIANPLFSNNSKICTACYKNLPITYKEDICPPCKERLLFSRVKEYIRKNDVTEFQVAMQFDIPLQKVKEWIREGRIQYKELQVPVVESLRCQKCGEPIKFGTQCSKCLRKSNLSGSATFLSGKDDDRFHHLQK